MAVTSQSAASLTTSPVCLSFAVSHLLLRGVSHSKLCRTCRDFIMRSHDALKNEEANVAAWEASKGGLVGAAKWGAVTGAVGALAYFTSPLYRSMTIQFKVYVQASDVLVHVTRSIAHTACRFLQMSGMVLGGMVEAELRLQEFEAQMRLRRKVMAEQARWKHYEQELAESSAGSAGGKTR